MTNRGVKFLHLANWVVAAFLAFVWMVQWDEGSPLPVRASLTVTAWDGRTTLDELRREMDSFARERRITFAQEVVDFEQRHAVRNLYLVNGDESVPGSIWLDGGYRDFTRSMTTRVHQFAELENRTPIGRYDVFGDAAKAEELRGFLASRGLSSDLDEIGMWSSMPNPVSLALSIMVFFSVVVVGASVLTGIRAYGVGRLQGLSYGSLLLADLYRGAVAWAVSGAVVAGGSLVLLSLYNGLAAFGTFAIGALVIDLLLTAAAFGANALVLLMIMQVRIQPALKGELPGRTASAMAYVLRVAAALVTVGTMATALDIGKDLVARERSYDAYERLDDTSALSLGNAYTLDEQRRLARTVGAWLREQDGAGSVVLAGQKLLQSSDPLLNGRTVLYVNEAFLANQPVRLASGGNYRASAANVGPDVVVPAALWGSRERIVADLDVSAVLREDARERRLRPVAAARGQKFFTYSIPSAVEGPAGSPLNDRTNAIDPVIVVLPSAEGLLSDDGYTAFASAAQVLFPAPAVVKNAVAGNPELQTYIRAVIPVAEQAAVEKQMVVRKLRLALFAAVIGTLVLVITGIGVVLIHARRNSQLVFARHVNGWRFSGVHRGLLTVELIVLTILVGRLPYQIWTHNRELAAYRQAGAPLPLDSVSMTATQLAAVAVLVAVMVGSALAALARVHRRVIREGASEA